MSATAASALRKKHAQREGVTVEFLFSPYTVAYVAAALISGVAAWFAWRRRIAPGGVWLCAMAVSCVVWALTVGLDYSSIDLAQHLAWGRISYLGATTAPVFFMVFAFTYTGDARWATTRRVAMLLVIPLIAIVMVFTNDLHHLVWTGFSLVPDQPNLITYHHGPVYWAVTVYGLAIALLASVRLLTVIALIRSIHGLQSVAIVVAVLLPWTAHLAYSLAPATLPGVDPSVTFAFTSAILSLAMLKCNLLDAVPVPRSVLVEELGDGIIVLDQQGRVVEINPAAVRLLGMVVYPRRIVPLDTLLPHWPEAVERLLEAPEGESVEPIETEDGTCVSIERSRLNVSRVGLERDLYVLRDVTAQRRAEAALRDAVRDLEALQAELREQAIRDVVTGLYNRRYLVETFDRELGRAAREGYPVTVVMFDIDHFKTVNDTRGHAAGDAILRAVGHELCRHRRAGDITVRYGGDEFLVVLPNTSLDAAGAIAERWRSALAAATREVLGQDSPVTFSFGVAAFPAHATTSADLLAVADSAVYESKSKGRDWVSIASVPVNGSGSAADRVDRLVLGPLGGLDEELAALDV